MGNMKTWEKGNEIFGRIFLLEDELLDITHHSNSIKLVKHFNLPFIFYCGGFLVLRRYM